MSPKQHARCRVIGCNNQKTNPPPKTGMFLVPSSAPREVFEKWVQLTGNEELCEIPIDHLKRNLRICERHFLPNQVSPPTSKIKRLLQRGIASVVPTQFSDNHVPITCGRIDQWRQSEHYRRAFSNNASEPPDPCYQPKASDIPSDEVPTGMQGTNEWEEGSEAPTKEWVPHYMVTQLGNGLFAIPGLFMEIPELK